MDLLILLYHYNKENQLQAPKIRATSNNARKAKDTPYKKPTVATKFDALPSNKSYNTQEVLNELPHTVSNDIVSILQILKYRTIVPNKVQS
ncbi:hypothetical protein DSO57_1021813 [Entomophthora muscae]|uniref:Uncharacterized protein n=1 Tax=Entomophthora muscae TaxID=34485 RepID=A0ACC2SS60_9FUNG|nr:hypothetical protein DSO57_1021813 [Entomophthora muscae]